MKSVLISIQPRWCELIASGRKTVEVRKTRPKIETPFRVYIYCTKGKFEPHEQLRNNLHYDDSTIKVCEGQGKVIGEFVCNSIGQTSWYITPNDTLWKDAFDEESCLTNRELYEYSNGGLFYEWYISDLVIYNKPRELSDFYVWKKCNSCRDTGYESTACCYDEDCRVPAVITRPPQSWCYVE